jgi:hypothetical protein
MCLLVAVDTGCNCNMKLFYTPNCLKSSVELCIKTVDFTCNILIILSYQLNIELRAHCSLLCVP